MGSASSTATGATLPSFGRFVYTRIPTATQDAPQRIEEGQEVWLQHLLPVLTETDPGVQDRRRDDRRRAPEEHHGRQEGWRGIRSSLQESHRQEKSQAWVSFLIAKKRYL